MQISGSYFFVKPGDRAFLVASNYTNYLELGRPLSKGFFLLARVEGKEFKVSARLFNAARQCLVELSDNRVVDPQGSRVEFRPRGGYDVFDAAGNPVLTLALTGDAGHICVLRGRFFDENGELVAEGDGDDFRLYRGPAVIGRSGAARGIVIEDSKTGPLPVS
jgi:hypothetical protein